MAASTRATNLRKVRQNFRSEIFIENTANTFKQRLLKKGCEIAQTMHEFSARNFHYSRGSLNSARISNGKVSIKLAQIHT